MKGQEIADIAKKYIGQMETPNNSGFKDANFEKKMAEVGWSKTMAWCSYFCELVWDEASNEAEKKITDKLFSGSATTTFKNFDLDKTFKTGVLPIVGAIAIFRHGSGWQGHAAIVLNLITPTSFRTIEGNTNDVGGREGYIVAIKTRSTNKPYSSVGLNFVGFIYP